MESRKTALLYVDKERDRRRPPQNGDRKKRILNCGIGERWRLAFALNQDRRRTHNMKTEDLLAIIIMQLGMIMMFVSLFALI